MDENLKYQIRKEVVEVVRECINDYDSLVEEFGHCVLPENYDQLSAYIADKILEGKLEVTEE
jgi:hypothetical protein